MKKNIILVAVFLFLILLSFQTILFPPNFEKLLRNDLVQLANNSSRLKTSVKLFKQGEIHLDSLRFSVAETRNSYKKIEFLIEYLYPEFSEDHLNGAPLYHTEPSDGYPNVLPPEGLQVIDEEVAKAEKEIDKHQLVVLATKFESNCLKLLNGLNSIELNTRDIIEASKFQIVRISTMGISGFDTPGSLNSLHESKVSLIHIKNYLSELSELNNKKELEELIDLNINFLAQNGNNFESFNRMLFIRDYLTPLNKMLNAIFVSKSNPKSSVNPKSAGLFEKDFLSPYFFTLLSKNEDSDELRELGKKLFFDPILSFSGKMSCSSCHNPKFAFTDSKKKSPSTDIIINK